MPSRTEPAMRSNLPLTAVLMTCLASGLGLLSGAAAQQGPSLLTPAGTVRLPLVKGRIDHLAYDPDRRRLFVAALGNNSVEVIDATTNTHLRSLTGFREPQGVAFVSDLAAVAVANGATGTLQLVDAQSFATRWAIAIGAAAAAAETPKTSSSSFTNSDASRSVIPFKYSTTSALVTAMVIYLLNRVLVSDE